jgi:hypothetical protein
MRFECVAGFSTRVGFCVTSFRHPGVSQGFCGLFESRPLRSKTLFSWFFACLANCFGLSTYPCMSMPAGAAPVGIIVLCAALAPQTFP